MRKIKITLEYGCFPVWVYDESGQLTDNYLPASLAAKSELENRFSRIQKTYDSLFLNDGKEFGFAGFHNDESRRQFAGELREAIELLRVESGGEYVLEEKINL